MSLIIQAHFSKCIGKTEDEIQNFINNTMNSTILGYTKKTILDKTYLSFNCNLQFGLFYRSEGRRIKCFA
jgi:hypothetical protein